MEFALFFYAERSTVALDHLLNLKSLDHKRALQLTLQFPNSEEEHECEGHQHHSIDTTTFAITEKRKCGFEAFK